MKHSTILIIVLALICLFSRFSYGQSRQVITVDQHGNIEPAGYVAGLSDIAQAEASAIVATQSVALAAQTMADASSVVSDVVAALTGAYGFAYVTGHVVSFAGAVSVNTNAASYIVYLQLGAAGLNVQTNGAAHDGHYVWHYYTAAMNSTPWIRYQRVIGPTNSWEFVNLQTTQEYTDTTVDGVHYDTIYRSTVWLPSNYSSAFFMAFCEILPGGQAGAALDIKGGLTINGNALFTGIVTNLNNQVEVWHTGLLKEVRNP